MRQLALFSIALLVPLTAFADNMSFTFSKPVEYKCVYPLQYNMYATDALTWAALEDLKAPGRTFQLDSGEYISLEHRSAIVYDKFRLDVFHKTVDIKIFREPETHEPSERTFACQIDYTINKANGKCSSNAVKLSKCSETTKAAKPTAPPTDGTASS